MARGYPATVSREHGHLPYQRVFLLLSNSFPIPFLTQVNAGRVSKVEESLRSNHDGSKPLGTTELWFGVFFF